jgi:hypothetical protein
MCLFAPILNTNLTTDKKPAVIEAITEIDQDGLKINIGIATWSKFALNASWGNVLQSRSSQSPAVYATISCMSYALRLYDNPF